MTANTNTATLHTCTGIPLPRNELTVAIPLAIVPKDMLKLFISYRRDDTHGVAQVIVGRIYDRLQDHYGDGNVFMDIDNIPPGVNLAEYLGSWVSRAEVVLAVIGPQWAQILVSRRDDPRDFVRIELESALARGIPVVPLLLRGARMPGPEVLTGGLARLAENQAFVVDDGRDFKHHLGRLIKDLDTHYAGRKEVAKAPATVVPPVPAPMAKPRRVTPPPVTARPPQDPGPARRRVMIGLGTALAVWIGFAVWPRYTPRPAPLAVASSFSPTEGTGARPYQNTIGMKFVGVPGTKIAMAIWETRVQDYAAFAAENPGIDGEWKSEAKGPDLPVVKVSWEDAQGFCQWLSRKEGKTYRLPTDHEWSVAVGIGDQENAKASPKEKSGQIPGVYPWGTDWPPPAGAGNYDADSIPGYSDGHSRLAPAGSYPANPLGLYDLGGNALEWCEERYKPASSWSYPRVLRGASWLNYGPDGLWSSIRFRANPGNRFNFLGFRVVLEGVGER